jgi:hypothetical protein
MNVINEDEQYFKYMFIIDKHNNNLHENDQSFSLCLRICVLSSFNFVIVRAVNGILNCL